MELKRADAGKYFRILPKDKLEKKLERLVRVNDPVNKAYVEFVLSLAGTGVHFDIVERKDQYTGEVFAFSFRGASHVVQSVFVDCEITKEKYPEYYL